MCWSFGHYSNSSVSPKSWESKLGIVNLVKKKKMGGENIFCCNFLSGFLKNRFLVQIGWFLTICKSRKSKLKFVNVNTSRDSGENKWEGGKLETHLFSHRQHNSFQLRKTSTPIFKSLIVIFLPKRLTHLSFYYKL